MKRDTLDAIAREMEGYGDHMVASWAARITALSNQGKGASDSGDLPYPAFRLTWRDGAYFVSEPNVGSTDCYTADQLNAVHAQAFHDGMCAVMHAREAEADRRDAVTEEAITALVAGPYMYHHMMDDQATREAKAFDRCRELTIENIRANFAMREAMEAALRAEAGAADVTERGATLAWRPLLQWAIGTIDELNGGPMTVADWGEDAGLYQLARGLAFDTTPRPSQKD